jgi:hypothetical protein
VARSGWAARLRTGPAGACGRRSGCHELPIAPEPASRCRTDGSFGPHPDPRSRNSCSTCALPSTAGLPWPDTEGRAHPRTRCPGHSPWARTSPARTRRDPRTTASHPAAAHDLEMVAPRRLRALLPARVPERPLPPIRNRQGLEVLRNQHRPKLLQILSRRKSPIPIRHIRNHRRPHHPNLHHRPFLLRLLQSIQEVRNEDRRDDPHHRQQKEAANEDEGQNDGEPEEGPLTTAAGWWTPLGGLPQRGQVGVLRGTWVPQWAQ